MEKKNTTLDKLVIDYFQNEEEWSKIIKNTIINQINILNGISFIEYLNTK